MREIKFRAWDSYNQRMTQVVQTNVSMYGYCEQPYVKVVDKDVDITKKLERKIDTLFAYDLMQYTGLKDKNGVEIYEGDIVKVNDYYDNICFEGIVEFDNASFNINQFGAMYHYRWVDYEVEVIGNIHENPELLEVNNVWNICKCFYSNNVYGKSSYTYHLWHNAEQTFSRVSFRLYDMGIIKENNRRG